MMYLHTHKKILASLITTFFALFLLLAPVAIVPHSTTLHDGFHNNVAVVPIIAHAAEDDTVMGTIWKWTGGPIINSIGIAILGIGGFFVWIGGGVLDYTISELITGMSGQILGTSLGNSIDLLWTTIRDICNLAFIFGLIYIGISTILGIGGHNTKRMLAQLIIGAILINFSLAITKIIIEFSNFTSYQIYTQMSSGSDFTMAGAFAQHLGISTIYKAPPGEVLKNLLQDTSFWFYIFAFILLMISAFSFLSAAILLLSRFGMLVLIMIGSPLLFAATVFPQTEHYAKDLWQKLFGYAFFAPLYLLLVFMSLTLLGSLLGTDGIALSSVLNSASENNDGFFELLFKFSISIFFMISSLTIAQKLSVAGGSMTVSLSKKAIGKTTAGLTAATLRATVGRVTNAAAESDSLKSASVRGGLKGWGAKQVLSGMRGAANSSYDVRKVGGVGKKLGIGEGAKGGYVSIMKDIEKKETEFVKSLGEVDDSDPIVEKYKSNAEKAEKEIKKLKRENEKLGNSDAEKAQKASNIDEIARLENEQKENNELYKMEKQRYVTGSATVNKQIQKNMEEKKNLEKRMRELDDLMKTETDRTLLETYYREHDEKKKQVTALAETHKKLIKSGDAGYAGVLESSAWYDSWIGGRMIIQDREAGIHMRKAFNKKAKMSKEDERHKEVVEASKKAGGNGGGGDDH